MLSTVAELTVSIGAGAILGAGVWQVALRDRLKRDISASLSSPDPDVRRAAVEVAASHGVGRFAKPLVQRVETETEPEILDAIAAVVARGQWEPLTSPELAALRMWSQQYLGRGGPDGAGRRDDRSPGRAGGSGTVAVPGRDADAGCDAAEDAGTAGADRPAGDAVAAGSIGSPARAATGARASADGDADGSPSPSAREGDGSDAAGVASGNGLVGGSAAGAVDGNGLVGAGAADGRPPAGDGDPGAVNGNRSLAGSGAGEHGPTAAAAPGPDGSGWTAMPLPASWPELTDVPPPPHSARRAPAAGPSGAPAPGADAAPVPGPPAVAPGAVLVADAASPAGAVVVQALRRLGVPAAALVEAGAPVADSGPVPSVPVPPVGSPAFADAVVDTSRQLGATAVLAPTAASVDALVGAGDRLAEAGTRTLLPGAGVVSEGRLVRWHDRRLDRVAAAIAGGGVGFPPTRGRVRGFVAEALVDGGAVVGAVVLEPDGPGATRLAAGARPVPAAGPAPGARAVHRPAVAEAIADAVEGTGYRGPLHVRGGIGSDGSVWLSAVEPGFSPALALALATGADLVGQWYAAVAGLPVDPARLRYDAGPVGGAVPSPPRQAAGGPGARRAVGTATGAASGRPAP